METELHDDSHYLVSRDKSAASLQTPYTLRFASSLHLEKEEE